MCLSLVFPISHCFQNYHYHYHYHYYHYHYHYHYHYDYYNYNYNYNCNYNFFFFFHWVNWINWVQPDQLGPQTYRPPVPAHSVFDLMQAFGRSGVSMISM